VNPNEDHEDFEMKTLERGNLAQGQFCNTNLGDGQPYPRAT
jgi:hypothetical protein